MLGLAHLSVPTLTADPISELQAFLDARWEAIQPACFPDATEGWRPTPYGSVPSLAEAVTPNEARFFLASVTARGSEPPLFIVHDNNKVESDRNPALGGGAPRGYKFFEKSGPRMGGLRLESIVQCAAMARLRDEFHWPREHLVCESPGFLRGGGVVLGNDALDILVLKEPVVQLTSRMPIATTSVRVAVEAKATAKMLDRLLAGMRACCADGAPHDGSDHMKCSAITELHPSLFLGVAAASWRLFKIVERDGRVGLGKELDDLSLLRRSGRARD